MWLNLVVRGPGPDCAVWSAYYGVFVNTAIVKFLPHDGVGDNDTPRKDVAKTSINEAINALWFHQHNEVQSNG